MDPAFNRETFQAETFLQEKECNDSLHLAQHTPTPGSSLRRMGLQSSNSSAPHSSQFPSVSSGLETGSHFGSYSEKDYDPEFEMPEDEISPGTQINEHVQQAEKPLQTTSPGTQINEHVQQAEKPSQTTRMIENDKFIQLVEEEKPKIEKILAETIKNHNELDAGQKTSVVKGLVLCISIIAATFFLGRFVNAVTATIAKAKNSKAEKTIKRQEELWSEIDSKMFNLMDNIPSTVASDQVASVRRSNGLKTVNDPPSAALVYSITYDDSEGYEYKSDIPKLVESITSKLAALVAICSSLKDIKTVNDLPSETSQSLRKTETKLVDVNNATRSIAAESKAANQFDSVRQFQKSIEAFNDLLSEFLVKLEEQGGYKYESKIEKLDEATTSFFENCIKEETCSQCGAKIS